MPNLAGLRSEKGDSHSLQKSASTVTCLFIVLCSLLQSIKISEKHCWFTISHPPPPLHTQTANSSQALDTPSIHSQAGMSLFLPSFADTGFPAAESRGCSRLFGQGSICSQNMFGKVWCTFCFVWAVCLCWCDLVFNVGRRVIWRKRGNVCGESGRICRALRMDNEHSHSVLSDHRRTSSKSPTKLFRYLRTYLKHLLQCLQPSTKQTFSKFSCS